MSSMYRSTASEPHAFVGLEAVCMRCTKTGDIMPSYKDAARRRAKKEAREREKLKSILAPTEAQGAARFLGGWASGLGGRPGKVQRAPHARGLGPPPGTRGEEIVG